MPAPAVGSKRTLDAANADMTLTTPLARGPTADLARLKSMVSSLSSQSGKKHLAAARDSVEKKVEAVAVEGGALYRDASEKAALAAQRASKEVDRLVKAADDLKIRTEQLRANATKAVAAEMAKLDALLRELQTACIAASKEEDGDVNAAKAAIEGRVKQMLAASMKEMEKEVEKLLEQRKHELGEMVGLLKELE